MAKPSYQQARKARGTATMSIEPAPKSFEDKNLDPQMAPGDPAEKVQHQTAKPGGSISPELNAPKQGSGGGTTKVDTITRT